MEVTGYLIVQKPANRSRPTAPKWLTKKPGSLPQTQVAIMLKVNVPDEYFQRPELHCVIDLPKLGPVVDSETVIETMTKAAKDKLGVTVRIL